MNYKKMSIEELEKFREEQQAIIGEARTAFMEAGTVLDAKLQAEETSVDDLEAQKEALEVKIVKLKEAGA